MNIVVDTGPLVALLNRNDDMHAHAKAALAAIPRPWKTCEAVVSEAAFLLARGGRKICPLAQLLARGGLEIAFSMRGDEAAIAKLMEVYANVPMSVADACLARMCEGNTRLFTYDDDFDIYRLARGKHVPRLNTD